jgi:hypothetical protein
MEHMCFSTKRTARQSLDRHSSATSPVGIELGAGASRDLGVAAADTQEGLIVTVGTYPPAVPGLRNAMPL